MSAGRRIAREWLLAALFALALGFVALAQGFRGDAWKFPTVVGALTAALALAELLRVALAGPGPHGPDHRDLQTPPDAPTAPDAPEGAALSGAEAGADRRGLWLAVWFAGSLVAVYVVGLLATVGVATAVYAAVFLRTPPLRAAGAGALHALVFWVSFDLLAGFRLWGGVVW